jgi:hypothetical protein
MPTVPRTSTGSMAEKAKPCMVNPGKGIRQVGPVSSREGVPAAQQQVAITRGERLFIKNTGHCKAEKLSTVADACSLPVPESLVQQEEGPVKSGGNSDPLKVA